MNKQVKREKIIACIESAHLSPSACNSQPWKYIVIDDPITKDILIEKTCSGIYSMNNFAKEAPVIIAVVSGKGKITSRVGGFIRDTKFNLIDIGISVEHFVLQASEFGLGTCILGWFDEKRAKKILSIHDDNKIFLLITLGWAKYVNTGTRVRKPLDEVYSFFSNNIN